MKKLHSINGYYILGTLPFVLAIIFMSTLLVTAIWQKVMVIVAGVIIIIWLLKKFWCLPRPERDYKDLDFCNLELPDNFFVAIYLSPSMDQYPFLKRSVEIISPLLKQSGNAFKIVISPDLMKREGQSFMRVAVMREVIRYRQAAQVKAVLGLVTPILALITIMEGYFALGWSRQYPIDPGYIRFFGPMFITAITICLALVWNKKTSGIDYQVDDELKKYFPKEEISAYIKRWDEINLPDERELINEKSRQLELFYIRKRIERL